MWRIMNSFAEIHQVSTSAGLRDAMEQHKNNCWFTTKSIFWCPGSSVKLLHPHIVVHYLHMGFHVLLLHVKILAGILCSRVRLQFLHLGSGVEMTIHWVFFSRFLFFWIVFLKLSRKWLHFPMAKASSRKNGKFPSQSNSNPQQGSIAIQTSRE